MSEILDHILIGMLSPPILFFFLGISAALLKSDLKIPEALATSLGIFLLLAIGIRSGFGIATIELSTVVIPAIAAICSGAFIAFLGFMILTKILKIDPANAGSIAGHYGAVSATTLALVIAYADRLNLSYEAFVPGLYPFIDTPALIMGIVMARIALHKLPKDSSSNSEVSLPHILKEAVVGKGVLLLFGGLIIGHLSFEHGAVKIMPFYDILFKGVLTLFLLDIGIHAGERIGELKKIGPYVLIYTFVMVPIHGLIGITVGILVGLSVGGTLIFATMVASASYISAPAVMRAALPTANISVALTCSILIAFPFNAILGIPLYHYLAETFAKIF